MNDILDLTWHERRDHIRHASDERLRADLLVLMQFAAERGCGITEFPLAQPIREVVHEQLRRVAVRTR